MRFPSKSLALFYSQLGTLIDAGVPIQQALDSASKTAPKAMRPSIVKLKEHVQKSQPLHQAIATQLDRFDRVDQHLIAVTEQSGSLEKGLFSLGDYYEKRAEARSKILSGSILPILLFTAAIFIVSFPKFILGMMGYQPYTLFHYLRDTAGVLIVLTLFLFLLYWGIYYLLRIPPFDLILDRFFSRIPIFGRLRFHLALARWLQSIRLLMKAGYGVVPAMDLATHMALSPLIAHGYQKARALIHDQMNVSQALDTTGVFPPILIQLWSTGEVSGRMDEMLDKLVETYEEKWRQSLKEVIAWLPRIIYGLVSAFIIFLILKSAFAYNALLRDLTSF